MPAKTKHDICTVRRLRRTTRKATRLYDRHFADIGIGIAQYGILQTIAHANEASISDIANSLDMDRTTLTRNLNPLITSELVKVGDGKSKRVRAVSLTAKGKKLLMKAEGAWRQAQDQVKREMGQSDLRQLHTLLAQLLERLPDP